MVVIRLIGGIGNQLFQYAAAKALSIKHKESLFLDIDAFKTYKTHAYGLNHFNIKEKVYKNNLPKWCKKFFYRFKIYKNYYEKDFTYNKDFFNQKYINIFLKGYFHSEQYFIKFREELLKDLKIVSPLKKETIELIEAINQSNSVSIHIRRGDYLLHDMHNTSKDVYYKKALNYILNHVENPIYYVFSDDMDWVKENFITNSKTYYVDINDAESSYQDLLLMSNCKHNVIANSSFSWWGAWLNTNPNRIVIAPETWFNDSSIDYSEVVPKSWIKIDNK
ncbi:hypothetical protein BFR04_07220 [Gaetbulibacter sp. 4G1]|nr:hypothetical protein BFR04_07220 [Gaetbulibacter sp. 4G1]